MATSIGVPNDTSGSAVPVAVEPMTSLNGAPVSPTTHNQFFAFLIRTGVGLFVHAPGDALNGLDVDVTRLPVATTTAITMVGVDAANGVQLVAATARKGLQIFNDSTQRMKGKYASATPVVAPFTFAIAPGGYWEMPLPIYQGVITGVWDGADAIGTGANITEET